MSSKNLNDNNACCPFFHQHEKNAITCEGIVEGTSDRIFFGDASKKLHYDLYCCYKYQECPRYKPLQAKYGEE